MLEPPWRVLQVIANHEKRVARHLQVRSFEHYVPFYTERSRWSDRFVQVERPLFAGYVFVRFRPGARLPLISTPGVLRLLGDDEEHAVSAAEINRIREGLATGCLLRPHPGVTLGTRVRVRHGVFEGVEGVVTELRHPSRVVLALAAIRQSFSLEVDIRDLEVLRRPVQVQAAMLSQAG